ncbi:MAG: glutamate mutase L [Firmicutes bacterium]|nr:glutamate mutase L [Bacillota bacterium]
MKGAVLGLDVGSTTTKATLFLGEGGRWRVAGQATAPTTVEAPVEDVMVGTREALHRLEQSAGVALLDERGELVRPRTGDRGVDATAVTSSAGGGLQMLVAGVMREITAESAERAALGAGAIVVDVLAIDDGRTPVEKVHVIRNLRPDMVLLSGGTDGGGVSHVVALAEVLRAARPRPRFGEGFRLPVVYAGNVRARPHVEEQLAEDFVVSFVPNLRPVLEREEPGPARQEILRLFLEHVMAHAPGYPRLLEWAGGTILPTPVAVGAAVRHLAGKWRGNVLAVDIGGATTDVFSVAGGVFNRTVSANLGLSYSSPNVFARASFANLVRWLPFPVSEDELRNWIANKMVRPTVLPETVEELMVEHALAREALRLSFREHLRLARELKGIQLQRTIADIFSPKVSGAPLVEMRTVDAIIGSGGVISHAPRSGQPLLMMLDGLEPEGVTELYWDRGFLLPHLGCLVESDPELGGRLLEENLVHLATVIAPVAPRARPGTQICEMVIRRGGTVSREIVRQGDFRLFAWYRGEVVDVELRPARSADVGAGPGKLVRTRLEGGEHGVILDARGRPLVPPEDEGLRRDWLLGTMEFLDAYPAAALSTWRGDRAG